MLAEQLKISYKLDKLEQLRKGPLFKDLADKKHTLETLNKRAAAKFSQQPLIEALIGLNNEYKDKYINTLNCATNLIQKGNKIESRYCKNRWCKVCNRIRTAKLINGYAPALDQLEDKYFVTLTLPNVAADQLRSTIKLMLKGIREIQELWRKTKQPRVKGIRKLECTYNPDLDNYHPHFHFIVQGEHSADRLIKSWLQKFPDAVSWAQDKSEAYDYKELFKYFTKLAAKSEIKKEESFYPEALHVIYKSIEKIRIIQPMGGIKLVNDEIEDIEVQEITDVETKETVYSFEYDNWVDMNTGEYLTSYKPTKKTLLYRNKIRYLEKNTIFDVDIGNTKINDYEENYRLFLIDCSSFSSN